MYHVPGAITVLAVDDDHKFLEIISHYLSEDSRYTVVTTHSAQEALEIVSKQPISAIIADYQMPEMDGLDLLKILRADKNDIPFIIFTGQGCESVAIEALNAGADFYLIKGEDPGPQFLVLRKNLGEIVAKRQADEALRISEAENRRMLSLLKATLDATEDGILVESIDGVITGYNERFLQLFQLEKDQVQGKQRTEIFERLTPQLSHTIPMNDHLSGDLVIQGTDYPEFLSFQDGRVIETHVRPQICEGDLVGRVWSYHDLTDRVRAEQALRESRERFRILFDNSPISHLALDKNGLILEVNQTWMTMLGYDRHDVFGKHFSSFCIPEVSHLFRSCLSDVKQGKEVHSLELILIHKDGHQVIVITDWLAVQGQDGSILQIQCALRDITNQRRTEEQLYWTESLLKEVVDLLPFGLCVTDGDENCIIFHNSRFYEIWNFSDPGDSDQEHRCLNEVMHGSPADLQILSQCNITASSFRPKVICSELELPDKHVIRLYQRKFSDRSDDTRTLWAFEDITLFKQQEEEIRTYARSLEILNRMISLSSRAKHASTLCETTLESAVSLMNFDGGTVYLVHPNGMGADLVARYDPNGDHVIDSQSIDTSTYPDIFIDKKAYFTGFDTMIKPDLVQEPSVTSLAVIPLIGRDLVHGLIILFSRRRNVISSDDQKILIGIGKEIGGALIRLQDQKDLRNARRNLENLVNSINDLVFVIDADSHVILDVNEEVLRRLGYCREDIIGQNIHSSDNQTIPLFVPDNPVSHSLVREHTLQTANGKIIDVETRVTLGSWNVRNALFYVSRDITESKIVQERVRSSEERLRVIFESSPIGIILCDADGSVIEGNQAVRKIFGTSDNAKPSCFSLTSGRGIPEKFTEEMRDGKTVTFEQMIDTRNLNCYGLPISILSDPVEIRVIVTPLRMGSSGMNTGYLALIEDITLARQSVKLLRESEAFNRGLITNLPDFIMVYDHMGKILYVNPSGLVGMRVEQSNLIGTSIYQYIIPEQRRIVENQVRRRLEGEEVPPYEIRILRFDGTPLDVMVQATMIPYQGKDAILVVLTDITSRKEGEEELEKYTQILQMTVDALATANKKLNLLSDVTRHDILNQVHIIFGYLDIMKDEILSESQKHVFHRIEESVSIIHRQIQFTRSYQDLGVNSPEWQNLSLIITNLSHPRVTIANNVQGLLILADPLLPKVFENLLDNSIRHGISVTHIEISIEKNGDDGISIIWADNGKGVPLSDKDKIFEKGFGQNTGFGLFLIREILALTGITINETGEEGSGARFVLGAPLGAFRNTS